MTSEKMELIELPRDWILAVWPEEEVAGWDDKPGWFSGIEHPVKGCFPNSPFQTEWGPFETKEEAIKAARVYWERRFNIPLSERR